MFITSLLISWFILSAKTCASTSSIPVTKTPLPDEFFKLEAIDFSLFSNFSSKEIFTFSPEIYSYIFNSAFFWTEGFKGILTSAFAPERDILASNWKCLDIFPCLGILDLEYPELKPPPCQSPKISAPTETITSALEKS